MFAMLNGRWPRVTSTGIDVGALETDRAGAAEAAWREGVDVLVADAVRAQRAAGFDLIVDGQVRWADTGAAVLRALADGHTGDRGLLVQAWAATAGLTDRATAQVVPGPYSLGRRVQAGRDAEARTTFTAEMADALGGELRALAAAGCPMVQVDEPDAIAIGAEPAERALFADAQQRLLAAAPGLHAMLLVTGGSAWEAGADAILSAPYRSYLFDLIAGPDNWYLVRAAAGDRGIVCAALQAPSALDQGPILDWAARYAASANGRGPDRVGLANASPLDTLTPEAAGDALGTLARAARLGTLAPAEAVDEGIDPRTYPARLIRKQRQHRERRTPD
jgi:Cobalamin-independent synthase, Catalytic domain